MQREAPCAAHPRPAGGRARSLSSAAGWPPPLPRGRRRRRGSAARGPARSRFAPAVATAGAVAALLYLVYRPWFLNYDARYALLWARDLCARLHAGVHGRLRAHAAPAADRVQPARAAVRRRRRRSSSWLAVLLVLRRAGVPHLPPRRRAVLAVGGRWWRRWSSSPARRSSATRCSPTRTSRSRCSSSARCCSRRGARAAGRAVLAVLARRRPAAARGVGAGRPLLAVGVARRAAARERALLAALVAAAPRAVGRLGLAGHRRPAALAARHGRPRRWPTTAAARSPRCPYWTAQYFGYALREPLVLGVPIGLAFAWFHARRGGGPAARRRGGDGRRVRRRPAVRPAADPPLHRHARPCCCASSTASRWPAGRCCRAGRARRGWLVAGGRRRAALGRLPAVARATCSRPSSAASTATARSTATCSGPARRPP